MWRSVIVARRTTHNLFVQQQKMMATTGGVTKVDNVVILPVPESRYKDVLDHVTPIFLRDEPLSHCFPVCTNGQRERDFREYATSQLQSGLCVTALEPQGEYTGNVDELIRTGKVVGSCLNRALAISKIVEDSIQLQITPDTEDVDPLIRSVMRLLTTVHLKLDIFSALSVDEVLEIGLASVEPTHVGKGLATKMMRASLELGAKRGFKVAKADATGIASAKACQRAGMTPIYRLPYADYKVDGKVVFGNTGASNSALQVLAASLQATPPYVLPLNNFKCKV
ncbi:arylalkylamine N-acetyltransferase 1 isoform X2 [Anabrus simplex]|uniref:arylalkylamine N-acetyltransferase 1 isoform X2 n=1 Tax=Anabrus simplex TaxID=316456 RepID=UPI0034DDBF06